MKFEPWDWQLKDVEKLASHNFTGLLNIQPGGTKTWISTLAIHEAGDDVVLVSAPQATFDSAWTPAIRSITGKTPRVIGNKNKATKEALFDFQLGYPGWYLTTPQFLTRTDTSDFTGDALILDEVHQGATMGSKLATKLSGYTTPKSHREALSLRFAHRLALSGTPARQNFENMWSIMRFLWPHLDQRGQVADANPFMWLQDRMVYETVYTNQRDRFGNVKTAKKWLNEKEPGKLLREAPCVITHKRRERCCSAHPKGFLPLDKPQIIDRTVELTRAQVKAINELETHMMTYLGDSPLVTELSLTQKQRIRQVCLGVPAITFEEGGEAAVGFDKDCASPFLDQVEELLTVEIPDENVVIYLDSQKFAEVTVARLNKAGIPTAEYSGATVKNRGSYLARFGSDFRVLVVTASSGGTGLDGLQHKSSTEIWIEQPVSLTVKTQAEARQDRLGAPRRVQRYRILDSLGYAEGRISEQLQRQLMLNKSLRAVN